eukprot:TRINITY_DN20547_c0_g1_i1.p1 TRINITY_DN20547_c0_g1~~TRINITY_DN20547_c0_g1_i1.p1  ORF type:complete len:261 (+),score=80.45 TRINITY_DN20547_c0_g1_i1:193-975(+)
MELGYLVACVVVLIIMLFATYRLSKTDSRQERFGRMMQSAQDDSTVVSHDGERPGGRLAKRKAEKERQKEERKQNQEARVEAIGRRQQEEANRRMEREFKEDESELIRTERLKILEEEKKQQEEEEALLWCRTMSIEETGEEDIEPESNMLQRFISDIKEEKVVFLEQLALRYELPVDRVVSTIESLEADGRLSGIFDDRGKFIFITDDEYTQFAKYIRQRGRVSVSELSAKGNAILNLAEDKEAKSCDEKDTDVGFKIS